MTEQMGNLLILSDALISTLNLEHLLKEIVSRLGTIMQVKHVSLLLYGREMLSPWAVAQWTQSSVGSQPHNGQLISALPDKGSFSRLSASQAGEVIVHAD